MAEEATTIEGATDALLAATQGNETTTESAGTEVQPEGDTHTPEQWTKLMAESKQNRERAQEYEKLYGQNTELKQFDDAARAYAAGDISTVQSWLLENAAAVHGLSLDDYMEKFVESDDEDDKPLTKREWKALQAEERQASVQALQQEQVGEIQQHATDLGYKVGSRQYNDLLWVAMNETGNDLDKAHEIIDNTPKAYVQEYIDGQKEKARNALRPSPTATAPGTDRPITNWKDAIAAGDEFLSQTS